MNRMGMRTRMRTRMRTAAPLYSPNQRRGYR